MQDGAHRRVTRIRNCAASKSSRALLFPPIRCNSPWQQGQISLSISTTTSIRGRCSGEVRQVYPALASPRLAAFRCAGAGRRSLPNQNRFRRHQPAGRMLDDRAIAVANIQKMNTQHGPSS